MSDEQGALGNVLHAMREQLAEQGEAIRELRRDWALATMDKARLFALVLFLVEGELNREADDGRKKACLRKVDELWANCRQQVLDGKDPLAIEQKWRRELKELEARYDFPLSDV